jgi:hypothetical protein
MTRNRPPEPPPPAPTELDATASLARQAHQVAGQLRLLSERMSDLGWRHRRVQLCGPDRGGVVAGRDEHPCRDALR